MELEKIIREFLDVIDFELCKIDDSITIYDKNNKDELNQVLKLPIKYTSRDFLRVFEFNESSSFIFLNVANTKFLDHLFVKNGIDSFNLTFRKNKDVKKAEDFFLGEVFYNDNLCTTTIGIDNNGKYICYKNGSLKRHISIAYEEADNCKTLSILQKQSKIETELLINCNVDKCNMIIKVNGKQIDIQEIDVNKADLYFKCLIYKFRSIIQLTNNGIEKLNNNLLQLILDYFSISPEFMEAVNGSNLVDEMLNSLIQKYFSGLDTEVYGEKQFVKSIND